MQPNQPPVPQQPGQQFYSGEQNTQPPQQLDYSFITNPPKPPKKKLVNPTSVKSKVLVIGGIFVVLLITFSVIKSVFFKSPPIGPALIKVAQQQTELLHLTTRVRDQPGVTSNLVASAVTTNLAITTQRAQLVTLLTKAGTKVTPESLALGIDVVADNKLAIAKTTSTYNEVFRTVIKEQFVVYQRTLKQAYDLTNNANTKKILKADNDGVKLLIYQLEHPIR
jgi:hypothetical protein